jgi:hypothetical protein
LAVFQRPVKEIPPQIAALFQPDIGTHRPALLY